MIFLMSPSIPFCTMLMARRNRSAVLRCCVPTKKTLSLIFLAGVADQLVFFQRQRQRLLAEDVLARLQSLDGDFDVPMVGRSDADRVDIVAIEDFTIVRIGVALPLAVFFVVLGGLDVPGVDVAESQNIGVTNVFLGVPSPLAARRTDANAGNPRAIVGKIARD